jgi:hypothetical protein
MHASGEELPAEPARGKEARALDQPEAGLECRAPREERRDRQEEIVHEIGLDEGAEDVRTGLAEDAAVAA